MNTMLNTPAIESHESELVTRIRAGERSACECFVRQYGSRLFAVAIRYLGNEHDAADAVQDAFMSAFRSIGSFAGNARLDTWLHRIVVNACLMKLRGRRRHSAVPIEDLLPSFDKAGNHTCQIAPWRVQAHDVVERAELRQQVRACIDQLPDGYRTILVMRDMDGLDTDETARLLGLNAGAVKTRLHRARQALRTLLVPHLER
jgi:RNA polymerase sigma-70 factor (ECF subfamily)